MQEFGENRTFVFIFLFVLDIGKDSAISHYRPVLHDLLASAFASTFSLCRHVQPSQRTQAHHKHCSATQFGSHAGVLHRAHPYDSSRHCISRSNAIHLHAVSMFGREHKQRAGSWTVGPFVQQREESLRADAQRQRDGNRRNSSASATRTSA